MTIDPLTLSIGIGLLVGLLFVEFFGLYAGGMVVPGYIALELHQPLSVVLTIITALIIFCVIRLMSKVMIIYGRRRIALIILMSFALGAFFRYLLTDYHIVGALGGVYTIIGFIIPGLIALAMDRQGIVETLTSLITSSIIVRLLLVLLIGSSLVAS